MHRRSIVNLLVGLWGLGLVLSAPAGARNAPVDLAVIATADLSLPDECRWKVYQAVDSLFDKLWRRPAQRKVIVRGRSSAFPQLPVLTLEDRSGDGRADFFSYGSADGNARSQEFGAFFDRNGDGRIDWLVYYGGMMLAGDGTFYFWHHHAIDTNGDGRFDVRVYTVVDADGDGSPDQGATTWLEDSDHDGLTDRATRIFNREITPIAMRDGAFPLGYVLAPDPAEQPRPGIAMPVQGLASVANDIAALSAR